MDWKFYKPDFEFKNDLKNFTWAGHMYFAYDLVRNLKPDCLVELGTYKGTSFFSFSQGVKDENLTTQLYCVDGWEGDEQTDFYQEDVFWEFKKTLNKYFKGLNTNIKKMYFDEAVKDFQDKSIDILHIDGLHTYEAVKHDYETWRNKVKDNGVILFHDIKVLNFGVKDLWKEVKKTNKNASFVEFEHNYGLGVMFLDPELKSLFTKEFSDQLVDYYFETSKEYRLAQRIIELENEIEDTKKGSENLDNMLKKVLKENQELHDRVNYLDKEWNEQNRILTNPVVKAAIKVSGARKN